MFCGVRFSFRYQIWTFSFCIFFYPNFRVYSRNSREKYVSPSNMSPMSFPMIFWREISVNGENQKKNSFWSLNKIQSNQIVVFLWFLVWIINYFIYITACQTEGFFFWFVYRPTRELFSHMETPPLPMKSCKFWPMRVL